MEQEMRRIRCLQCGKEIQVPKELDVFSCVYCGSKMSVQDYSNNQSEGDEADLRFVQEHLLDCIRNYPDYYKNFSKKKYDSSFQTYAVGIEDVFRVMDRYICATSYRRDVLIDSFVEQFLADWDAFHHQGKNAKRRSAVKRAMFNDKLTLAWYTVPAILSFDLSIGPDFTEKLQQRFSERYPDNIFRVGTYSDISLGFRKRGMCFITTAVCANEGKTDDCPELTAFRKFRDGWLSESEGGPELIEEYYEIAPAIVQAIKLCDDPDDRCAAIRLEYLEPCYQALQEGKAVLCRNIYIRMVRDLASRYGLC